ncbi:hypothetical protein LguiA_034882 [Lonicera macranthoides]
MATSNNTHVDLEDGGGGRHSATPSQAGGAEIVEALEKRESCASQSSVDVEVESGVVPQEKVHLAKSERDCRICHMRLEVENQESAGVSIQLGCSCKDDLGAAHRNCAEAWFKIKGNKTCEICGSTARNVAGADEDESTEEWHVENDAATATARLRISNSTRNFWQGHRFLNFMLACMVFAFVMSWLFHFHVPSH